MRRAVMLRGKAQEEREQDKADSSLLLRRENKNLSPDLFGNPLSHFGRGLTCMDRYLPRTFL